MTANYANEILIRPNTHKKAVTNDVKHNSLKRRNFLRTTKTTVAFA